MAKMTDREMSTATIVTASYACCKAASPRDRSRKQSAKGLVSMIVHHHSSADQYHKIRIPEVRKMFPMSVECFGLLTSDVHMWISQMCDVDVRYVDVYSGSVESSFPFA